MAAALVADIERLAPRAARLQLARRPFMIGAASSQAFLAASASLKVTYIDPHLHDTNVSNFTGENIQNFT